MTPEIGGYELIDVVGHGGMGDVWRARHRRLAREAAIKLARMDRLPAGYADLARQRFETEARVTAALCSPHTIRVFDCGVTEGGDLYYAMELLRGCDFQGLVRGFGPLPSDRALYLLAQICDSIAEAHAAGLVHGDVKPANLYACRLGLEYDFAKVLDFGLARPECQPMRGHATASASLAFGTPAYMAPEVIAGTHTDRRSDVYALGCVAYFLMTGALVFEGASFRDVLEQHLRAEAAPPSTRTECVIPPDVDELVLACLQKNPRRRPSNAGELRERLVRASRGSWNQRRAAAWWQTHLPSIESHASSICPSFDVFAGRTF